MNTGMQAGVIGELRVEGDGEQVPVTNCHRVAIDFGQDLHRGAVLLHPGGADEDGANWLFAQALDAQVLLEALALASEGVAAAAVVADAEVIAIADDHARAAAEDRPSGRGVSANRVIQAVAGHSLADRGRFPARDHEAVEPLQLLGGAHLAGLGLKRIEHQTVRLEVPLDREDPDAKCHASGVGRRRR